jgi:hypothetical protein
VSEKARLIGDKIFDLFVNVLFHRYLNSELITGVDVRTFVNATLHV